MLLFVWRISELCRNFHVHILLCSIPGTSISPSHSVHAEVSCTSAHLTSKTRAKTATIVYYTRVIVYYTGAIVYYTRVIVYYTRAIVYYTRTIVSVLEMPGQNVIAKSKMVGHFYIWWTQTMLCNQYLPKMYILCMYV